MLLLKKKYTEQLRGRACGMSDQCWKQLHFNNNIYMPNLWLPLQYPWDYTFKLVTELPLSSGSKKQKLFFLKRYEPRKPTLPKYTELLFYIRNWGS